MVNDGSMDHSLGKRPFLLSEGGFAEDSFQQFADWCDQSTNCTLRGQDVSKVYDDLLAKADAGTLIDPSDGTTVDPWDLLDVTQFYFVRPRWVQLGQLLTSLSTGAAAKAKQTTFAKAQSELAATRQPVVRAAADLVADVRPQFCEDWSLPIHTFGELDALYNASLKVAPRMRASVEALSSMTECIGFPGKVNNPQHRLRVQGTPTILMMNGIHDPATGYTWATNAARQLGKAAQLVTYDGAGHVVYSRTPCTRAAADNYWLTLTLPAPDTHCAANNPA
jgi:hypothetical protein